MARTGGFGERRKRLGVLGGSFNPLHRGHLAVAEAARQRHDLDRVLFIPAGDPPHKQGDLAPAEDRLRMVEVGVRGHEAFEASDLEVSRPGKSYTFETLEELHRRHPGAEVFFIMGEDSLEEFPTWKAPERILSLARVVVVNRTGTRASLRPDDLPGVPPARVAEIEEDRVRMEPVPIESTGVRRAARAGEPLEGLVPRAVADYIRRHALYGA